MHGFVDNKELEIKDVETSLKEPTDKRIFVIYEAFAEGYSIDKVHELTKIDKWFLQKLYNIYSTNEELKKCQNINVVDNDLLRRAKLQGFSDFQIARALGMGKEMKMAEAILVVRARRKQAGIIPHVKQIDTLAAEYPAQTNYLYLTYIACSSDAFGGSITVDDRRSGYGICSQGACSRHVKCPDCNQTHAAWSRHISDTSRAHQVREPDESRLNEFDVRQECS